MATGSQNPIEIRSLKNRADFLRLRHPRRGALRFQSKAFLLVGAPTEEDTDSARFGLTVTKKIGNAVCRNRIKRRLRAAIATAAPLLARPGHDYVLIARLAARTMPFDALVAELRRGLASKPDSQPKSRS